MDNQVIIKLGVMLFYKNVCKLRACLSLFSYRFGCGV